jgi:hypothetical protein
MGINSLYPTPTFARGVCRSIDFWGMADPCDFSNSQETADAVAMWADWKDVGADLVEAVRILALDAPVKNFSRP